MARSLRNTLLVLAAALMLGGAYVPAIAQAELSPVASTTGMGYRRTRCGALPDATASFCSPSTAR
jgi:hypothetical protein